MNFVALFQLGKTEGLHSLSDRSDTPEFAAIPPDSVEKRSAIHIDPQVYFPINYRDMEVTIRKKHTKNFLDFIKLFGTEGIVSAHKDQASDGATRHHAIHLDMAALINNPAFEAAFDKEITELIPPPSVILTPQHEVARALGVRAVQALSSVGRNAEYIQHPTLLLRDQGATREADSHIRAVSAKAGHRR